MRFTALTLLFATGLCRAAVTAPTPDTERLFHVKCAGCHGAEGQGGVGASFKGKLAHPTPAGLYEVIKNGIPGTAMPASSALPDPMIKKLAAYVLYLNKKK